MRYTQLAQGPVCDTVLQIFPHPEADFELTSLALGYEQLVLQSVQTMIEKYNCREYPKHVKMLALG